MINGCFSSEELRIEDRERTTVILEKQYHVFIAISQDDLPFSYPSIFTFVTLTFLTEDDSSMGRSVLVMELSQPNVSTHFVNGLSNSGICRI